MRHRIRLAAIACLALLLAACGSAPKNNASSTPITASTARGGDAVTNGKPAPALPKAGSGRGAYYKDDGPGDNPPPGLELTLDAEPKVEPYSTSGNKPYVVFGKTYTPMIDDKPFSQRGIGSWYGKKFHGQKTSSGELYDMYKMTAAHPTLPIPSYARVTNLANGKQVIVKINDRGPFHTNRIVDLSYTAALKLDYLGKGSTELLLERLLPADIEKMAENRKNQPPPVQVAAAPAAAVVTMPVSAPATVVANLQPRPDSAGFEALVAHQSETTTAPVTSPSSSTALSMVPAVPVVSGAAAVLPTATPMATTGLTATALPAVSNSTPASQPAPVPEQALAPTPSIAPTTATVTTPTDLPPPVTTTANTASGFYLQFGAFGLRSNAEATYTHLQNRLAQLPSFEIVQQGTLYRLFSGPFATRDEANQAIQLAVGAGMPKPIIVQR